MEGDLCWSGRTRPTPSPTPLPQHVTAAAATAAHGSDSGRGRGSPALGGEKFYGRYDYCRKQKTLAKGIFLSDLRAFSANPIGSAECFLTPKGVGGNEERHKNLRGFGLSIRPLCVARFDDTAELQQVSVRL